LCCKQDSDQDQDSYLLDQDWSRTRKNLSSNTSDIYVAHTCNIHRRNLVGDTGDVSGDPLFLLRFCIWRSSKYKSDVCHVLCEVLIMLDVTHSQVDAETEFGVVLLDSVSLSVIASIK